MKRITDTVERAPEGDNTEANNGGQTRETMLQWKRGFLVRKNKIRQNEHRGRGATGAESVLETQREAPKKRSPGKPSRKDQTMKLSVAPQSA